MRVTHLVASLLAGTAASASFAVTVPLYNPSFEEGDPSLGIPSWQTSTTPVAIPGSTAYAGHFAPSTELYPSIPDGVQVVYLANGYARMAQTTAEPLTAGRTYDFSVYLGRRLDQGHPRTWISLLPESQLASFLADPLSGSPYLALTQVEAETIPAGTFVKSSVSFDTNSPANAGLLSLYAGENMVVAVTAITDGQVNVDMASLSYSVVPEPTLLAIVPATMVFGRRRRV